jgi:hypothetical protein
MAELYTDLDNLANDAKDWKCKLLFNQAVFDQGEGDAEDVDIVDLCEFLPFISVRDRKENQDYPQEQTTCSQKGSRDWLEKILMVELKLAAIQCGYSLAIRTSKVETNEKSDRAFHCSLNCLHVKINSTNSSHQKSHQKTTVSSEKDGASKMSSKTNSRKKQTKTVTKTKCRTSTYRTSTYRTSTKRPTDKQCLCPFKSGRGDGNGSV